MHPKFVYCGDLLKAMTRRKTIPIEMYNSNPVRVKSIINLILLGLGTTLGYGIYFLVGTVALTTGPAAIISITIAATSAIVAALSYLEFQSRLPTSGSPYFYTYIQINEIMAFLFGWNMILEYTMGVASMARGLSGFIRFIIHQDRNCYSNRIIFSCYQDFYAVIIVLLVTLIYTWGVKQLPQINDVITVLNIITICIILVAGFMVYDTTYWTTPKNNTASVIIGNGGFIPFGGSSILVGAAKYFYLFIGFGCITTTAEQITRPDFKISVALTVCLGSAYVFYVLVAAYLTMMIPYYAVVVESPITEAFGAHDMIIGKWIVTVGAILAILNEIFCCQLPVTRTVYTMGVDGLLSRCLAKINDRTRTPANATIFCGCISAIAALIFNVEDLIELTSLGTLCIRCMSAMSIIMIHYRPVKEVIFVNVTCWRIFKHLAIYSDFTEPNLFTANLILYTLIVFIILSFIFSIMVSCSYLFGNVFGTTQIVVCGVIIYMMIHTLVLITRQPKLDDNCKFVVPCSPLVPCFSIFLNILLMVHLKFSTWILFIAWIILGLIIYFCYGIRESAEALGSHRNMINGGAQREPSARPPTEVQSNDSTIVPQNQATSSNRFE